MTRFLAQYRWLLAGGVATGVLAAVFIETVPFAAMAWAGVTGEPDLELVQDVRTELLAQQEIHQMLARHEAEALRRYQNSGQTSLQHRHLAEVDLTPLGVVGFYDVFAFRVRTDVVDGQVHTSFLVRPGFVPDANAVPFFSRQCESTVCERMLQGLIRIGNALVRSGVLTTYYLNVTENDATSSITFREAVSTSVWARRSAAMHQRGQGRSFR